MNVLLVSTEIFPLVSRSSAGPAVASLAKALRLLGHEVTVVLPRLPEFEEAGLLAARRLTPLTLPSAAEAHVYEASLPSGARLVLLDTPGAPPSALTSGGPGQALALGRFSDGVAAYVIERGESSQGFEVVHVHDALAGLVLLKLRLSGVEIPKVLTVYDGRSVGLFPADAQSALGIPENLGTQQGFKSGEELSILKGVLPLADAVLAPSEAYAEELVAASRFGGISRSFRSAVPVGVLGGIDHSIYNPATDAALPHRYDAQDPSNKGRTKTVLVQELGLALNTTRPLVFFEETDALDGGLETVFGALVQIVRQGVSLVLTSEKELSELQKSALDAFEGEVKFLRAPDAKARRRLLAASDFYLGLERHNPSGERLLQAARYGVVPITLAVDAARDVVIDADAELKTGTGFLFDSPTQRGVLGALGRAVAAYRSESFLQLVRRVLRQDSAWDRPARRHLQIYRQVAGGR